MLRKILPELIHLLSTWLCSRQVLCYAAAYQAWLLTFLHDLGTSLDAGDEIDVIYLDFRKKFSWKPFT